MFDMFASPSFHQRAAVGTFIDRRRERGVGKKGGGGNIFDVLRHPKLPRVYSQGSSEDR